MLFPLKIALLLIIFFLFWVFSSDHTQFASSIGARYTSRLQVNIFALLAPQLTPNYACIHGARASQQPKVDSDSRCAFQSLGPTLTCYLLRKHTPPHSTSHFWRIVSSLQSALKTSIDKILQNACRNFPSNLSDDQICNQIAFVGTTVS